MIIFIPKAIEITSEPYDKIQRYRIFAIEFIATMLRLKSDGLYDFINMQVQQIVLRLIVQFPNASNLMGSVFRLIRNGLEWDLISDTLIEHFVPVMIVTASNKVRTAAAAHSMDLLDKIYSKYKYKEIKDKIQEKIEPYAEFCNTQLCYYRTVMTSSYGGEFHSYYPKRSPSSFLIY